MAALIDLAALASLTTLAALAALAATLAALALTALVTLTLTALVPAVVALGICHRRARQGRADQQCGDNVTHGDVLTSLMDLGCKNRREAESLRRRNNIAGVG